MTETVEHGSFEEPGSHLVQFYDAEPSALIQNVAAFIDEGLKRSDSVVVIATPEHSDAFLSALGKSRGQNETRTRRLVILDAQATLDQFMRNGQPDWRRFEQIVGGTIRGLRRANPAAGLRAYGEMVGILWAAGQVDAAVQLEKFWNVLLSGRDFTLFCGYPIDVFADEFHVAHVHDLLCAHTHVLPGGSSSVMEEALDRAVREVLGDQAQDVRRSIDGAIHPAWGALPGVEATILWLRNQQPQYAGEILSRARNYYRACA
jgi:hypothetical protein